MKVNIAQKMTCGTFYSVIPVNVLLRITALSNIYSQGDQLVESGSLTKTTIYLIIFGCLNVFCLYFKFKTFKCDKYLNLCLVKFSNSIQITYWISYFEYIIDLFCVYKYGRDSILNYFKTFEHIDHMLGNPSYNEIRKTISYTTVSSATIFLICSFFDYVIWSLVDGLKSTTIYSVDYLYCFLNMLTLLDVLSHIIQIEYRLKTLHNLLQDHNKISSINHGNGKNINICIAENDTNKSLQTLKMLSRSRYFETAWFSRCYLILLKQVTFLNNCYGFRVLASCINSLFNAINLLNLSIRTLNGTMKPRSEYTHYTCLPSIFSAIRAVNYGMMSALVMYRCEQAYKESERILETVDLLLVEHSNNNDLKTNLSDFRNLLITRPIKFHAAKFVTMDYTLLVSMCSVVVTYTIIMLQNIQ